MYHGETRLPYPKTRHGSVSPSALQLQHITTHYIVSEAHRIEMQPTTPLSYNVPVMESENS
jgi:hypothetical protein